MAIDLELLKDEYPFKPKKFAIDGETLSYLDEGPRDAHTIVMLHGNPTWSFYYRKLVLALRDRFRVIVPDHMGCGLSSKPQNYDYSLATHIHNLNKLLTRLQINEMTLALHDWGGAIGMGYAVGNPQKVKSLVIFNTAAFIFNWAPSRILALRAPIVGDLLVRGLNAFSRAAIDFKMATAKPERFTDIVRHGYLGPYDSWKNRAAVCAFVKDIPMTPAHPSYALLRSIDDRLYYFRNTPTIFFWGARDFCFDLRFLSEWKKRLDNTENHVLEDAGHLVVEDAHEDIIPLLNSFLENIYIPK